MWSCAWHTPLKGCRHLHFTIWKRWWMISGWEHDARLCVCVCVKASVCVKLFWEHSWPPCFSSCCFFLPINASAAAAEMSVRMSNLDNERDDRDEDSHEDRGISEYSFCQAAPSPRQMIAWLTPPFSLHFQSATLASLRRWSSGTHTRLSAGGATGDGPGRRATTVGPPGGTLM